MYDYVFFFAIVVPAQCTYDSKAENRPRQTQPHLAEARDITSLAEADLGIASRLS